MRGASPLQIISLAPQSLAQLPPLEFVSVAAQAAYAHIGVRTISGAPGRSANIQPCLIETAQTVRALKILLALEDLRVRELEYVTVDATLDVNVCARGLEWGAELGAQFLVVTCNDPDSSRLTDKMAALAALAASYGLQIMIEFVPWLATNSIERAYSLACAVPRQQIGIQIDMLHLFRSGGSAASLAKIDPAMIPYIQLCDAPVPRPTALSELRRQSSEDRFDPGFGDFDLASVFAALPRDIPISLEVPNRKRVETVGALAHAIAIRSATLAVLSGLNGAVPAAQSSSSM